MKTIAVSITEGRKRIFELADEVQTPGNFVILTQNGAPKAVLLGIDEFESLVETIEVLQQDPNIISRIEKIDEDMTQNKYDTYIPFEEMLSGALLVSEPKKTYEVSNTLRSKKPKISKKPSK
ncbi:MAG: type II toxin-antitoxin system Phd/YefM family antitoxin [Candidatus Gracilibacteria bacterium]